MNLSQVTAKAIVLFGRLDSSLGPLERFVFFRLWLKNFDHEIDISTPNILAKEIGIHSVKLRGSIQLLIDKGMLDCVAKNRVKAANILNGKHDLRYIELIVHQLESKKNNGRLFYFIYKLLSIIYEVRISHKQSAIKKLLNIDYKAWLVLFGLVIHGDEDGIVLKVGMHELGLYTGMNRYSIIRSLNKLFSLGILRSKINGTLDNGFLNFTSAIYLINLSHPIWDEYCRYKKYILIKNPSSKSLLKQALDVVNNLDKSEHLLSLSIQTLHYIQFLNIYQFENDINALIKYRDEFKFASGLNEHFTSKVYLSKFRSGIRLKQSDNQSDNLQRLEFIFKYVAKYLPADQLYASSKIDVFDDLALYQKVLEFKKYFGFNDFESHKKSVSQMSKIPKNELIQILETSQLQIYSFIIQYLIKNEAFHLIDPFQQELCDIRPIPLTGEIQMSGYMVSSSIANDQLCIVTFEPEAKGYRKVQTTVEMTIENQKIFGLLDQSCTALAF